MFSAVRSTDESLTFKIGHIDKQWTRLLAFTNTQGRLLNESDNSCDTDADANSGRFVHVEQERSKLRENEQGWNKMVFALSRAFECEEVSALDEQNFENSTKIYPNPFNSTFLISGREINKVEVYSVSGLEIFSENYRRIPSTRIELGSLTNGVYIVKVISADGASSHLMIKESL